VNFLQKKNLILENREKTYVVDGIATIYKTFVLLDLEKNTYRYLAGSTPRQEGFPPEGEVSDFMDFVVGFVGDDEEKQKLGEQLTKEMVQRHLGSDNQYLRYEFREPGEEEKWDSMSLIALDRKDEVVTEILFTYQDVTKVKKREQKSYEALKEAYQAVESANHAKSNFLSNMSHDIRTPMNAIMGMTAIAAMNIDNKERVKDCLNKITVSSKHLLGLINEVLDMSKIESGKLVFSEEEFSLSDTIESIVTMFLPQTEARKQNFIVNIADVTHEEVIGDSMRLQQVFVNILGNAVKFTQEGGTINFNICEKPSGMYGCGCYVFTFEDNGMGMDEKFQKQVFEPFARAERAESAKMEGTGLGMSIVKNIVQMMNGDIQVESRLGEGTKFTVTVYLKLNASKHDDVEGLANLTVLVADDDQFAGESACLILNDIGMVADWVVSGEEAVGKVIQYHEANQDYAAVILDWKMPGMDGIATAKEIRAKVGENVPIIILSAFDYSSVEQEAREAGVNAFIAKPLFRSRLVYVMKSLMLGEKDKNAELEHLQDRDFSGKRILLVEDNELNMEIALELLGQTGVTVETASDGRQAFDLVTERPAEYYDLVLMDIQMPVMNGYQTTEAIRGSGREDLKTLPIVAMTADAFMDDVRHAKECGMNGHISKPIEIEKLMQVLDTWIAE
jgi:signal transduction histidine kinase/DNA-binding response OmpR family regulator